jgi:hypothetical protein
MATPIATTEGLEVTLQGDLESELCRAEQDFEQGAFIELTVEELDRCIAVGEWPWASGSSE